MKKNLLFAKMLMIVTFTSLLTAITSVSSAQYTFPELPSQPILVTDAWQDFSLDVGAVPAGTYASFTVTCSWSGVSGGPWSNEARIRFNNGALRAEMAPTSGAAGNTAAATLTWTGAFNNHYFDGSPLSIGLRQTWPGSTANWNNLSVSITLLPAGLCESPTYSLGNLTCANNFGISNVTFADLNNSSGCLGTAPFFEFFSSPQANVLIGETYPLSVSLQGTTGFATWVKVWIDFNDNGNFDEPGELIFDTGNVSDVPSPFTTNYTIPSVAPGQYRMRVRSMDADVNSCSGDGIVGEVEDYLINISTPPTCTGTPNAATASVSHVVACVNSPITLTAVGFTIDQGIEYQWQSSPNGIDSWADVVGATTPVSTFNSSASDGTTFYRMRTLCTSSSDENFTNVVSVETSSESVYCENYCETPLYSLGNLTCANNFGITNVTFGDLNNSTACNGSAPYFTLFNTPQANLEVNETYPLSVSLQGLTAFITYVKVWIDFDQNGSFEDAGELIFNSGQVANVPGPFGANITIPNIAPGQYRMRVRSMDEDVNSCSGDGIIGEVEDYILNILPQTPCAGIPAPGNTLSSLASTCPTNEITLTLENATSGSGVSYQWQTSPNGSDWTNAVGAPDASTWTTSQSDATWYRCIVSCSNSSESTPSAAVEVGLTPIADCYCEPTYTFGKTDGDLISNVEIPGTTLSNNSGTAPVNPAYTFFTGQPNYTADLQAGTTYNVEVSFGSFTGQHAAVWVDFNENGIFEESERIGFTNAASTAAFQTVSFPISLPCNPNPGVKRMRVRNVWNVAGNLIDPCLNYGYGETEDYDVTILAPPACPMISGLNASNITPFGADLNWNIGCVETAWDIHISESPTPPVGAPDVVAHPTNSFAVTGLNPETVYYAHVRANCGIDGESNYTTISFTTPVLPPSCLADPFIINYSGCDNYPISIDWIQIPEATGYNVYIGTTPGGNEVANPFDAGNDTGVILSNPTFNTTYYFTVVPYNAGGEAVGCVQQQVSTGSNDCGCYALYSTGKLFGDLISNVEIPGTTLANNSGTEEANPSFTYFTGQPNYTADLVQGGSYNVNVSVGTWGDQHIRAWIDYNDDGVFDDSESIGSAVIALGGGFNASGFPPAVFNVNLSSSAPLGTHRMRIRGVWNDLDPDFHLTIDPCLEYGFGETEDYDITIVPPVTTQLQAGSCGANDVAPNQLLFATNVGAPQYRFRVVGANNGGAGWNGNTFILDRPHRYFYFSHLIPSVIAGETYSVEVAVGDGFGNFGPYGAACDVTLTGAIPTTQIQTSQCGATVNGNNLIFANQIFDAQGYRFKITGPNNGDAGWDNDEFILDRPNRNFYFSWLVPGATPGGTFSVEVAYLLNDGVTYSPYGAACNITLNPQTTQIQASQCGATGVMPNALVFANQVFDAQGYRFRITGNNDGSTGWNDDVFILDRPNRNFNFQWGVPGSLAGETYEVEVAFLQNDGVTYSAYGIMCEITLFGTSELAINDGNEIFQDNKSMISVEFGANASHNPFTTDFGLQVLNVNDQEPIAISIYDMSGKLIERNAINPMDLETARFGANLAAGMYMIEVRQGSNQAMIRQVKN